MKNTTISFIGAGNMARSLIGGLINAGFSPDKIWASNPRVEKLQDLAQQFAIKIDQDNQKVAQQADVLIFSVKPQVLKTVAQEVAEIVKTKKPLIISIAAGVRAIDIKHWLGSDLAIVRCMPNTPALIQCGATALFANSRVTEFQKNLAESILRAVGLTLWIDHESQLDTVTALSGSGPAYFFLMIEALEQAAIELGLPKETAHLLTIQTALGSAKLALECEESIQELRKRVTSPGGTTERGVNVLLERQMVEILHDALVAARKRSQELANLLSEGKELNSC